ncbi:ester cyclase [Hephaestia sp. GCM10023244]|uniref:ester cyclase n=1 Tax=unclassified Hephaestia TaxID=2631281 RepID=UPI002076D927|nr:ester cyclase [Hephaestia sp. MAHUQ-44]MCM8732049.1 ester cyclase [Hephaestia sp. MAHUQ-44]
MIERAPSDEIKAIAAIYYAEHAAPMAQSMRAIAGHVIYHNRPGAPTSLQMWQDREVRFRRAMSEITTTIHRQIAEGDLVTTQWTLEAVHTGRLMDYPASGKRIRMASMCIDRVVDGLVVEHWGVRDLLSVLRAIGVVPTFQPPASGQGAA